MPGSSKSVCVAWITDQREVVARRELLQALDAELRRDVAIVVGEDPVHRDREACAATAADRSRLGPEARTVCSMSANEPAGGVCPCPASVPQLSVSSTVAVGPASGTAQRNAGSRAAASAIDPAGLAVAEQADPLRIDLRSDRRKRASAWASRARMSIVRGGGALAGIGAARLADAALVVGDHRDPEQLAVGGEDLELVARLRCRAVDHHDRRERAAAGRQRQRCGDRADADLACRSATRS